LWSIFAVIRDFMEIYFSHIFILRHSKFRPHTCMNWILKERCKMKMSFILLFIVAFVAA